MLIEVILLILGLFILWKASDMTVDAAKRLAEKYSISPVIVGLTIVSIGTSLPEIFTNIYVGLQIRGGVEVSGLAIGTTLGSQISQITIILGITAMIGALCVDKKSLKRDGTMLIVAILGMSLAGMDGRITPLEGIVLSIVYLAYLTYISITHKIFQNIRKEIKEKKRKEIRASAQLFLISISMVLLVFGGKLVVDNAHAIAMDTGISDAFIGIFIIGLGTSLPELSVGISGMRKKAEGVSLGTLLGSNITDPLLSLGLGAMVAGFTFDTDLLYLDIPFWFIVTCLALVLMWFCKLNKKHIKEGIILIACYGIYVCLKIVVS